MGPVAKKNVIENQEAGNYVDNSIQRKIRDLASSMPRGGCLSFPPDGNK